MEEKKEPKPPRRQYLVNRHLQLTYSGFIVWIVGIGMVIAWLITYHTIWSYILTRVPQGIQLPQIIQEVNFRLFWTLVVPGFIILVLVGWWQIFLLHRIAGPAYRLKRTMSNMKQGTWPEEVRVRDRDFLKEVVEELNSLLNKEKERHEQLVGRIKEADALLKDLEGRDDSEKERLLQTRELLNSALHLLETTPSPGKA